MRSNRGLYISLTLALYASALLSHGSPGLSAREIAEFVTQAVTFNTRKLDATAIALFNLMGVWPAITAVLLLRTEPGKQRRRAALPFVLASFVGGMFVLAPYLAFVRPEPSSQTARTTTDDGVAAFLRSRAVNLLLTAASIALVGLAMTRGSAAAFASALDGDGLVAIMAVDFAAFWVASADLIRVDAGERGYRGAARLACVPVLGPLLYLATTTAA